MDRTLNDVLEWLAAQGFGVGVLVAVLLGWLFKQFPGLGGNENARRLLTYLAPALVIAVVYLFGVIAGQWHFDEASLRSLLVVIFAAISGKQGAYIAGQAANGDNAKTPRGLHGAEQ